MNQNDIKLLPGEKIPQKLLDDLKEANEKFTSSKNFTAYLAKLKEIFQIWKEPPVSADSLSYLGGFCEGEASINVSATKFKTAVFGLVLDPEFSITQHVNGVSTLFLALRVLKAGRIRHKNGSNATLSLIIDNRKTLQNNVLPFYEQYVLPFCSPEKERRYYQFKAMLDLFDANAHKDLHKFLNELLPIWNNMRKQAGQVNQTFKSLDEAQEYIRDFHKNKNKQP